MIELHKLSHEREPFFLNPDLIERIDASPDCHVALTTGTRIAVCESVEQVVARIKAFRVDVLADALRRAR
jgi:flagellar protein FlbD